MISEELVSPSVLLKSCLLIQTFGFGQHWTILDASLHFKSWLLLDINFGVVFVLFGIFC